MRFGSVTLAKERSLNIGESRRKEKEKKITSLEMIGIATILYGIYIIIKGRYRTHQSN